MSQSELEARAYPTRCLHFLQSRRWETLGELEAQKEEHSGFKFMKVPLAPLWGVRKGLGDCWRDAGKRGGFGPGRKGRRKRMHLGFIWKMELCKTEKMNERYQKHGERNS